MGGSALPVWAGAVLAVAAIALLRLAWGRPRRSRWHNAGAWALLGAGVAAGGAGAGAWGIAIVSLAAMATALACLARAAWISPPGRGAPPVRRANILPDRGEPLRLGRRTCTFLLTVPAALIVSLAVALGGRALGDLAGLDEADSGVLAFFLMPFFWAGALTLMLIQPRRGRQIAILALPGSAALAILLATGFGR